MPGPSFYLRHGEDFLVFDQPVDWQTVTDPDQVLACLRAWDDRGRQEGLWAACALAYEAGAGFDSALAAGTGGGALVVGGLYPPPRRLSLSALQELWFGTGRLPEVWLSELAAEWTQAEYEDRIEAVFSALQRGESYQANLTFGLEGRVLTPLGPGALTDRSVQALFLRLMAGGQGRHGALVQLGDRWLVSLSPELFFEQIKLGDGRFRLETRPMKGTAARGQTPAEDTALRQALALDEKNRAENLMITDMIRNDLGRIARPGTVSVPRLFHVETYPTVHQMVSEVTAETGRRPPEVLQALFPCASITGAPKVSTVRLLAGLEAGPRGFYTGSLGWWSPEGQACFNVAIRTLEIEPDGQARLGVGGGIVADSRSAAEWAEAWLKSRFLQPVQRDFALTEALLWEPETGWFLPDRHFARLAAASRAWGTDLPPAVWAEALQPGDWTEAMKVRILLLPEGRLRVEVSPAGRLPDPAKVGLALQSLDADSPFVRFKTDRRQIYEACRRPGLDDTILYNARGELTETLACNLVLERAGQFWTPALSCGLLAGTYRAQLLAEGKIQEAVLTRADLYTADKVWLINSVRRWRRAVLVEEFAPRPDRD